MTKLTKPSVARLVKQKNSDWYIIWYGQSNSSSIRYRQKFGLNRIKDLNERQKWADSIVSIINKANFNGEHLTPAQVEDSLSKNPNFNSFVNQYLEDRSNTSTFNTLKSIRVHRNRYNEFARDVLQKQEIDFEDFNLSFPLKYQKWAFSKPREWSTNYCSKSFQILKMILNDALEQEIILTRVHQSKRFSLSQVEVDDIALEMSDIEKLINIDEFKTSKLTIVRDTFLFACLTGLRYCDFSKLTQDNFSYVTDKKGKKIPVVKVITQKTGEKVVVPLHDIALKILDKYKGGFPDVPCNQVFNKYIKIVCKESELTEKIILRQNIAGQFVQKVFAKYQAVSTHTARRTFATIAYFHFKIPTALIMKITGHKTEKEFFKYIKITKEEAAIEMAAYFC